MPLRPSLQAALAAVLFLSPLQPSVAQDRSPIADLLRLARTALDDLRFHEADSIAMVVADLSAARRGHRIQAYAISAAARYPELEDAQRPDSARAVLAKLVRLAPEVTVPREFGWAGLDSLHRQVRRFTFGATAFPSEATIRVGPDEQLTFQTISTRRARFYLLVRPVGGGRALLVDTTAAVEQGTLRFRLFAGERPEVASGRYLFEILAVDDLRADTIRVAYPATIEADPLVLATVPTSLPSDRLKPERSNPVRTRAVVAGAIATVATVVASRMMRSSVAKEQGTADGRAVALGFAIGGATGAGAWLLDRGLPIPDNQEANRATRDAFDKEIAELRAENERRRSLYRAVITFDQGN